MSIVLNTCSKVNLRRATVVRDYDVMLSAFELSGPVLDCCLGREVVMLKHENSFVQRNVS